MKPLGLCVTVDEGGGAADARRQRQESVSSSGAGAVQSLKEPREHGQVGVTLNKLSRELKLYFYRTIIIYYFQNEINIQEIE